MKKVVITVKTIDSELIREKLQVVLRFIKKLWKYYCRAVVIYMVIAAVVTRISPFTTAFPFRIFSIDREDIVEINLHEAGTNLYTIDDEEQIDEIVETMNDIRYCFAFPYFELIARAGDDFDNIILDTETDSAAFNVSGRLIRYRNIIYVVVGNDAIEMSDKYFSMIPD